MLRSDGQSAEEEGGVRQKVQNRAYRRRGVGGRGWGSGERMDSMEARQSTPHMDNSSFQGG